LGLSDKEARVYLSALELGQSSVQKIAAHAGVNRATTYSVLESLIQQGLCSTFDQGKKTYFVATAPDTLISLLEIKKKEIEEREKNFQKILPALKMIHNKQEDKPVIRFFDGKEGMLNSLKEFIEGYKTDNNEPVRMVYSLDRINEIVTEKEREKFRELRLKNKVQSKVILSSKNKDIKSSPDGKRINLVDEKYPITCYIEIYGDSVQIASLGKELSAVLIHDKEIAKTLKSVFDLAWEQSLQMFIEKKKKDQD